METENVVKVRKAIERFGAAHRTVIQQSTGLSAGDVSACADRLVADGFCHKGDLPTGGVVYRQKGYDGPVAMPKSRGKVQPQPVEVAPTPEGEGGGGTPAPERKRKKRIGRTRAKAGRAPESPPVIPVAGDGQDPKVVLEAAIKVLEKRRDRIDAAIHSLVQVRQELTA